MKKISGQIVLLIMMLVLAQSNGDPQHESHSSETGHDQTCDPKQSFNNAYVKYVMAKTSECKTRMHDLEKEMAALTARETKMQSQIDQLTKERKEEEVNCVIRLKTAQLNGSAVALEKLKEQLNDLKISKQTVEQHMKDKKQLVDAAEQNLEEQRTKMRLEHSLYMEIQCNMTKEKTIKELNMKKSGDKYYYYGATQHKSWHEADRFCRSHNLALVSIRDEAEMTRIVDYVKSVRAVFQRRSEWLYDEFWIGLSDSDNDEGRYVWSSTGQNLTFSAWFEGEPNNYKNEEHCVEMRLTNKPNWNDRPCEARQRFMCETRDFNCL